MKRILIVFFAAIMVALLVFVVFIYTQDRSLQSRIEDIKASQVREGREEQFALLQKNGFTSWQKAKLYLIDVRSRDDYASGHIKGALSKPLEVVEDDLYMPQNVEVVIYGSQNDFQKVKEIAEKILNNTKKEKAEGLQNTDKILVVEDGFEGLRNAGLEIEHSAWD